LLRSLPRWSSLTDATADASQRKSYYRRSVEDEVHSALSSRLQQIRSVFGTIPDTLEGVWVATALGEVEEARRRISEVPRHPFDLRYAQDLPETAWERCVEVLDHYDVLRAMKQPW
jgi:hypothetical protein